MSLKDLLPPSRWEREKKVRKQVAIGATVGLTVGAVAGVLLAPKAGKEIREDLVKNIQELPEKTKELSAKLHSQKSTEVTEEQVDAFREKLK